MAAETGNTYISGNIVNLSSSSSSSSEGLLVPLLQSRTGAWQRTCGKKGYAKLRENKYCFMFSLENRERYDSCLACSGIDSMPLDQNVKMPVLRISSEVAVWRNSTSQRSADEVDVMEYLPAETCRRGTKDSDRCVHCTSSSTACIQFLSEPEASAARADGEWCVRDMETSQMSRAAAFWTLWSGWSVDWGRPANTELQ